MLNPRGQGHPGNAQNCLHLARPELEVVSRRYRTMIGPQAFHRWRSANAATPEIGDGAPLGSDQFPEMGNFFTGQWPIHRSNNCPNRLKVSPPR